MKKWSFLLAISLVASPACSGPTDPEAPSLAVTGGTVVLTPATVSSHPTDVDTIVGTVRNANGSVCGSCAIAWRVLDSTKIQLVSTFKPAGQTKPNAAVIRSLAVGTTGLRGGNGGAADTATFTITADEPPPPDTVGVQADEADDFVESISVQLHLGQGGIYDQFSGIVKPRLLELGVRHTRERMFDQAGTQAQQQELAAAGIQMTAGCWPEGTNFTDASRCIDLANAYGTGTIDAFDGWNEVNGRGVADWETAWVQWQQAMWNTYGANGTWNGRPVLANSFTSTAATNQLFADKGNQSNKVDAGNMHSYPGGGSTPEGALGSWLTAQNQLTGPKPNWVTETGYHTCTACTDGVGVSELGQAKYTGRLFFTYWEQEIVRTNLYEMMDEGTGNTREDHWGLVRFDGSVKPAFTAVKNIIALLEDPGSSFTPGRLDYTLTGALSTTHAQLFQKRDGRFYLVLWQAVNVYDVTNEVNRTNAADAVTITLAGSRTVNTYLPRTGITATPKGTGTTFTLNVPDEVLIVELD